MRRLRRPAVDESVEAGIRKAIETRRPFATEIIALKAEVLAGVKVVREGRRAPAARCDSRRDVG